MTAIGRFGRRHFLRGASGFALGVPLATSLLPRSLRAAEPRQKRLVVFATDHGGIHPDHMLPRMPAASAARTLYDAAAGIPAHRVWYGPLEASSVDGWTRISDVLKAPDDRLPPRVLSQMNVLAGFDIADYLGHNRGSVLGNYAANDEGKHLHHLPLPTIDQLVASHSAFAVRAPKLPSLSFGLNYGVASDLLFAASVARQGETLVPIPAIGDTRVLWDRVFDAPGDPEVSSGRPRVVDRVYEHYHALVHGAFGDAARLSRADRQRLEHHLDLLQGLSRKLDFVSSCDDPREPARPQTAIEALHIAVDIVAAALRCGLTHVAVITTEGEPLSEDHRFTHWHNEVAHDGGGPYDERTPLLQTLGEAAQSRFFREVYLRMVGGLDLDEDDDGTFLDRSLVLWGMESGEETHENFSLPVVTAGHADGFFETGRFIDYRNHDDPVLQRPANPFRFPGVVYNRFLGNVLQAMNVPPDDYVEELRRVQPAEVAEGARGYGLASYAPDRFGYEVDLSARVWPWSRFRDADASLPGLVRGA